MSQLKEMPIMGYIETPITWDEFLIGVQARIDGKKAPMAADGSMELGNIAFRGTASIDEAMRLARDGWADGANAIATALDSLPPAEEVLPDWRLEAAGVMPCIPAFLAGDAECMFHRTENAREERRVTLLVPLGYSWTVSAAEVMQYGIAVTAIVRSLEASGVSPAIYAVRSVANDGLLYNMAVMVRQHGEPLDLTKVAFSVHPSFLRRLGFAYCEQSDGLWPVARRGYGLNSLHGRQTWEYAEVLTPECGIKVAMPNMRETSEAGLLSPSNLPKLIQSFRAHVEDAMERGQ